MRLPEIAKELRELAVLHNLPGLATLANAMKRRRMGQKPPQTAQPMTPALANAIRAHRAKNPSHTQTQIAAHFNVNPGRVSEVLKGHRV